ncbi:MAG TPA: outer membrane protein transport protein [Planctomycetota bacterium]|nr:outer membrane protein transport protein [Planctomycetota bacterium]
MRTRISLGLPALAVGLLALAQPAFGNGFALQDHDAKALGMSNAFAALADNPSANFYNPAGMSQLDGIQVEGNGTYIQGWSHFSGANSSEGEANTKPNPIFFPTFFGSAELPYNFHLGFGVFLPYGLSIEWPRDWAGRYGVTKAEINITEFNPNLSYKYVFTEGASLSLAAGFSVIRSALKLEQAIDLSALGASDGFSRLYGDTDDHLNFRWNVAVLLALLDGKVKIGAGYRAPIENIRIHGTAELDTPAATGLPRAMPAFTRVDLPDQLRMGVAVSPLDNLTLELDATWTNWTKVDKILLEFENPALNKTLNFGLNDSWFVALGANVKVVPDLLQVRAGVYYDETPVRLETRQSALPDSDRKGFSVGLGITPVKALEIDLAYLTVFFDTARRIKDPNSPPTPGTLPQGLGDYDTFAHVAALSVVVKF